jgi:hypothetical protein
MGVVVGDAAGGAGKGGVPAAGPSERRPTVVALCDQPKVSYFLEAIRPKKCFKLTPHARLISQNVEYRFDFSLKKVTLLLSKNLPSNDFTKKKLKNLIRTKLHALIPQSTLWGLNAVTQMAIKNCTVN